MKNLQQFFIQLAIAFAQFLDSIHSDIILKAKVRLNTYKSKYMYTELHLVVISKLLVLLIATGCNVMWKMALYIWDTLATSA